MEYRDGLKIFLKLVAVEVCLIFILMYFVMKNPSQLVIIGPAFFVLAVIGGSVYVYKAAKLRKKR